MTPLNPSTIVHAYTSESEWLDLRKQDITSTESSALFGASPYVTAFELYHRKLGNLESTFSANPRMIWGSRLESAIAYGIAEDNGWTIEPLKSYWRIPELRIGSSFDYVITSLPDGPALLEIKLVDGLAYLKDWQKEDEDNDAESPVHIEMQLQHQLLVSGFKRGFIGALVGGNKTVLLPRERDEAVIGAMRKRIAEFWSDVDNRREPKAVMPDDAQTLRRIHNHAEPGKILDATGEDFADLRNLVRDYDEASKREKQAKEDKDVAAAEILAMIGDHESVILPFGKVSAGVVADSPGTLITAEMEGTYYGARKGYRACRFYPKKGAMK